MSIELVMPSNHLILCHPLLLLPSIFPSIKVFSSESALCIKWPCSSQKATNLPYAFLYGRITNNLRYADDTTLMVKSEEELKSLLMKVKEESEKAELKLNIQKTKIMASDPSLHGK